MSEVPELRAAHEAMARRDWTAARALFRRAGNLSDVDLAALADACWWLGEMDEYAAASADLHRRLLSAGATAYAASVAFKLGYTEMVRGHAEAGFGWAARARRLFEEAPEAPERGFVLAVDAQLALQAGDLDTARSLADQVLELGERAEDATLQALGRLLCGTVDVRQGQTKQGLRELDEAMLSVLAGGVVPEWAGAVLCSAIDVCHILVDLSRAERWVTLTERWCEGHATVLFTGVCRVHRAELLLQQGAWARAEQEVRDAVAALAGLDVRVEAAAHYCLAELCRLQGDLDGAEGAYRRAHQLGRDPLPGLALLQLDRGRVSVAGSVLDAALATSHDPLARAPLLAARVEVNLAAQDPGGAGPHLRELTTIAENHLSPGWLAEAARLKGAALLAGDRPAEAVGLLRTALVRWQEMAVPYRAAQVRFDLARAYEALGDHDTARREHEEGVTVLGRLGARANVLGAGGGARAGALLDGLTPRELEVLREVAGGRTNREVARSLYISERTVARHLANIYLKTEVSTRTAAVAWARGHGLV
ncbi:LuxR C-terminal-related transcriptional regulator [Ornithinimicrobium sufpigmenti]|uniref:LuxR C-terminal-related transcriptional regulator n=1 Tax=Ornithinimicrobium sufpigmenti TaxID=2508882 RepID=UPI0010362680|nr:MULTISPECIES: LuxR C-terminal-related transcriptional regulator [unclassified Ornithinimicrobium]